MSAEFSVLSVGWKSVGKWGSVGIRYSVMGSWEWEEQREKRQETGKEGRSDGRRWGDLARRAEECDL